MITKEKKNVLSTPGKNMAEELAHQPGRLKKKKRKEVRKMDKNCADCGKAGGCQITENMICHPQILIYDDPKLRAERRTSFVEPVGISFIINNPEKEVFRAVESREIKKNGQKDFFSVLQGLNRNLLRLYFSPLNSVLDFIGTCKKY